jgi:iron complex transport system substrate-binding protein
MTRKRIITTFLLIVLVLTASAVFAGGVQEEPAETSIVPAPMPDTRVITDMRGNDIVLPASGTKYAVLGGPISLTPYLFGVQDDVIAVTKGPQKMKMMQLLDPSIKKKPAPRTTNGNVNVEELLMAGPDCVISFEVDGEIVEDHTDIPVIFLTGSMGDGFAAIKNEVSFFGEVFQNPEKAVEYRAYLDNTLAFIDERLKDVKKEDEASVYLGEGLDHLAILGGDTFMNEWLAAAHCTNASYDIDTAAGKNEGLHSGFKEISMEQVLEADPEIIVINEGTPEELMNDSRWKEIRAAKDGRVYMAPGGLFVWSRPSIESAVLYPLWIAYFAYPEYFEDISLEEEYIKFYKAMFDFTVDEKLANAVITGGVSQSFTTGF